MAVMMGSLYTALVTAKVPTDQAQKAAEEVAGFEAKISRVKSDLGIVKAIGGVIVALQLMTLGGLFGMVWRTLGQ